MTAPRPSDRATAGRPSGAASAAAAIRADVLRGLLSIPKTLPPKLFYDEEGARLFERISELPEYYLTRAELEILRAHVGEIAALSGPDCALIEYGSGAGIKVRLLLDALERPAAYVPVDISHRQLTEVATELAADYPDVVVRPVDADYTKPFRLPPLPPAARHLAFFPGSTIGNFHPPEGVLFLRHLGQVVGPGGALVLGVDRRKDRRVLDAAYNDAAGVTAAFNLNILARLNRELGADFDLSRFRHRAFFNEDASRVEMHLECVAATVAHVGDTAIPFARGETIWTESSYKYDRESLGRLVSDSGFVLSRLWTDQDERFWVAFLDAA